MADDGAVSLIRLRDFPGVQELEDQLLIASKSRGGPDFREQIEELSAKLFGITDYDTLFALPDDWDTPEGRPKAEAAYDAWEAQFGCDARHPQEQVAYFAEMGWDVTDRVGRPLLLIDHLARPLEAAIKGLCGASSPIHRSIGVDAWAAKLSQDRDAFQRRR